MARINKTVVFLFLLIFGLLLGLQVLRQILLNSHKEDTVVPNTTINYYTVVEYPKEVDLKNLSIQTVLENDKYCIGYKFLEATDSYREPDQLEPVSLVTHATSNMIESIENLPYIWDGPISLGLFLDSESKNVLKYLAEIYRCDIRFKRKMTIHFAFQKNPFQKECPTLENFDSRRSCQQFFRQQNTLRSAIVGPFQHFPINLMRNIARKGALSDIHFMMDQNMTPSKNFAYEIKSAANKILDGKHKRVLAIRRFETETGAEIPRDPRELKESKRAQKTFEFHHKHYSPGYYIDGLDEWFHKINQTNWVSTSRVQYPGYIWEAQLILHKNDPYNADYFPSKDKTMHSLIYELCRAGYTFHVPTHVFSVHDGIEHTNTVYSKATITPTEASVMMTARDRFKKEMDKKYPLTLAKCGDFSMV